MTILIANSNNGMQLLNREMQKVFHQQRVLMDLITIFFASAMLAFFVSKCDGRTLEFMLGEWWQMIIHQCFYTVNILIKIDKKIRWKIITLFKLKNNTLKTLVQKKKRWAWAVLFVIFKQSQFIVCMSRH